ncbi:MAG TPA: hypothetical protein VJX92_09290 [Methylomirabilota bacterium]|nr:hypothetical protein [Methylomirabilota bacterium]
MRTPHRGLLAALLLTGTSLALSTPSTADEPIPGTTIPCAPIAEKRQDLGCYVVARQMLGALREGAPTMFWHLDVFPTRAAAEAARGRFAAVVEAFDRTWLFTLAPHDWRPEGAAQHVATVGPLPLEKESVEYAAMYLATTFAPSHASFVHVHPGPEAWFIVSGEHCLETPLGPIRGRAGDGRVVRGNLPMIVHPAGSGVRRVFTLVLHDTMKPATIPVTNWTPQGLCRS